MEESTAYSYRVKAFIDDGGNVEGSDYSNVATAETFSHIIIDQGFEEFDVGAPAPEESGWAPYRIGGNSSVTVTDERATEGGSKSLHYQDPRGNLENEVVTLTEHRPIVRSHTSFNIFIPTYGDIFVIRGGNSAGFVAWEIWFRLDPTNGNIVAVRDGSGPNMWYTQGFNFPLGQWNTIEVNASCLTNSHDVIINGTPYRSGAFGSASVGLESIIFFCFPSVSGVDFVWEDAYIDDVFIEEIVDEGAAFKIPNPGPVRDSGVSILDTRVNTNVQAR